MKPEFPKPKWAASELPRFICHSDFGILSSFDIRHSSFSRRPLDRVLQDPLVSRMLVRRAVVPESDADDSGLGMVHDPDRGIGLSALDVFPGRQHLDGRALLVRLD